MVVRWSEIRGAGNARELSIQSSIRHFSEICVKSGNYRDEIIYSLYSLKRFFLFFHVIQTSKTFMKRGKLNNNFVTIKKNRFYFFFFFLSILFWNWLRIFSKYHRGIILCLETFSRHFVGELEKFNNFLW